MKMRKRKIEEAGSPQGACGTRQGSCPSPSGGESARWRRINRGFHKPRIAAGGWKCGLVVLAAFLAVADLPGQDFALDWFTVDGGGGTSIGAPYAVTGTIGQPDTGILTSGNLTLQGGFWSIAAAIQVQKAPRLSITLLNGTVTVSWPLTTTGFSLEQAATLTGSLIPWTPVSPMLYRTNSLTITVDLPVMPDNSFLRLRKP